GLPLAEAGHLLAVRLDSKFRVVVSLSLLAPTAGCAAATAAMLSRLGLELASTASDRRNVGLARTAARFGLPPHAAGYVAACAVPMLVLLVIASLSAAVYGLLARILESALALFRRRTADGASASTTARTLGPSSPNSRGIRETA